MRSARAPSLRLVLLQLGSTLWLSGCLFPEPVTEEPPPALDVAPTIETAQPNGHIIASRSLSSGVPNNDCVIEAGLPQVTSPLGLPLTARFYVNLDNPDLPSNPIPLGDESGGQTDFPLQATGTADTLQLNPPNQIPLDSLYDQGLLIPFSTNTPDPISNVLTVVVSDGFLDSTSPAPAAGRYSTSYYWVMDLTGCDPRQP